VCILVTSFSLSNLALTCNFFTLLLNVTQTYEMFECPICQDNLVRSEEEVEELVESFQRETPHRSFRFFVQSLGLEPPVGRQHPFLIPSPPEHSDTDEEDGTALNQRVNAPNSASRRINRRDREALRNLRQQKMRDHLKTHYTKIMVTPCGHLFHYSCLQCWFTSRLQAW
jgi:hypothetical protein